MQRILLSLLVLPLALSLTLLAACASTSGLYNTPGNLGLQGYDPVSYFPDGGGAPRRGKSDLAFVHEGITYRFANQDNWELFAAAPGHYTPAYGGWCAYAMVDGEKVSIDPRSFLIQGGRLMLFYEGTLADTRARWLEQDVEEQEAQADQAWSDLESTSEAP